MGKPRLLDLFCDAGGAATGYHRAGFEVVGVDIKPQPRYPFEFHQADALTYPLEGFDVVHASPPCQAYSSTRSFYKRTDLPELIEPVRALLVNSGRPYVIENVVRAPLIEPLILCGMMFDLRVLRHRLFETWPRMIWRPPHPKHPRCAWKAGYFSVYGDGAGQRHSGDRGRKHEWAQAMGINWMTRREMTQAIPPLYTEWVGLRLLDALRIEGMA